MNDFLVNGRSVLSHFVIESVRGGVGRAKPDDGETGRVGRILIDGKRFVASDEVIAPEVYEFGIARAASFIRVFASAAEGASFPDDGYAVDISPDGVETTLFFVRIGGP